MIGGRHLSMFLALVVAGLALRPQIIGMGPLLDPIERDLHVSHGVAGLLTSIPVLCMGVAAPLAIAVARRIGTGAAISWGLLGIAGFGLARAFAPSAALLLLLTIPLGVAMAICNTLLPVAVKRAVPSEPLTGTGSYSGGILLGGAAAAAAVVPLASWLGDWRDSLVALSVVGVAAAVGWLLIAGRRSVLRRDERVHEVRRDGRQVTWRDPVAWRLAGLLALLATAFYGLSTWLPAVVVEHGWSEDSAGHLLGFYNFVMLPATLAVIVLGRRLRSRWPLMLGLGALLSVSAALLAVLPGAAYAWAFLAGCAQGALFTLTLTLPLDLADRPEAVAALAGFMLGLGYTLGSAAPFVLGAVRDLTGSFATSMWVLAAAGLATTWMIASLRSSTAAHAGARSGDGRPALDVRSEAAS